ncbi:MAG: sirohydrochlorin chelatase [Betaproteobacteria bacterium]
MNEGLVLFAHGSRDPDWAQPFEKILSSVSQALPECAVRLAYLEHMKPSLPEALAQLRAGGVRSVRVVPLFFGLGGHLKEDLPRLVAEAPRDLNVRIAPPLGEQEAVIEAIARAIATDARASP